MNAPVIVAVVEDGGVRAYHRDGSRQLTQTAMFAVGRAVAPEQLAAMMADLAEALDWGALTPAPPPVKARAKALPKPAKPVVARANGSKLGRPTQARVAAEVDRIVGLVTSNPGITLRQLVSRTWPDQRYSHNLHSTMHNRVASAVSKGRLRTELTAEGHLVVYAQPLPEPPASQ